MKQFSVPVLSFRLVIIGPGEGMDSSYSAALSSSPDKWSVLPNDSFSLCPVVRSRIRNTYQIVLTLQNISRLKVFPAYKNNCIKHFTP